MKCTEINHFNFIEVQPKSVFTLKLDNIWTDFYKGFKFFQQFIYSVTSPTFKIKYYSTLENREESGCSVIAEPFFEFNFPSIEVSRAPLDNYNQELTIFLLQVIQEDYLL